MITTSRWTKAKNVFFYIILPPSISQNFSVHIFYFFTPRHVVVVLAMYVVHLSGRYARTAAEFLHAGTVRRLCFTHERSRLHDKRYVGRGFRQKGKYTVICLQRIRCKECKRGWSFQLNFLTLVSIFLIQRNLLFVVG